MYGFWHSIECELIRLGSPNQTGKEWRFALKLCLQYFLGSQKAISTWYLPMSALYTGICFHQIPTVAFLMGSDSQLVVNYNPILCHISLTSLKPVFCSIYLPMSALYTRKYLNWDKLTALCMSSGTHWVWSHNWWVHTLWAPEPIHKAVNLFQCKYFLLYKADIGRSMEQKLV